MAVMLGLVAGVGWVFAVVMEVEFLLVLGKVAAAPSRGGS
jgi:hypothetical protein